MASNPNSMIEQLHTGAALPPGISESIKTFREKKEKVKSGNAVLISTVGILIPDAQNIELQWGSEY